MEVFKYLYGKHNVKLNNSWKQQNKGALEFDSFKKNVTNLALPACKTGAR